MEQKKQRVAVQGLRRSEPDLLPVLTQEALRATLGRLEAATLCDLLALSELESGLGVALQRDLRHFRDQTFREISDLPDSPVLSEFARDLAQVPAGRVPACLRGALVALAPTRRNPDASAALAELIASWEGKDPEPLVLRTPPPKRPAPPAGRAAPIRRAPVAAEPAPPPVIREKLPTYAPGERKARTPTAQVDERRVAWIEEEVMNRLDQYGVAGLKEAVLVAGARHRAPWKDMTEDEVLVVLRRLKRDNRVRFSAGRWFAVSAR